MMLDSRPIRLLRELGSQIDGSSMAALPNVITLLQSTAPADGDKPVAFTLMGRATSTRIERPGGLHISVIVVMNGWRRRR